MGYQNDTNRGAHIRDIDVMGVYQLQMDGEEEDLDGLFNSDNHDLNYKTNHVGSSCSALIKVLPKNEDIYFSQVTWSSFESMLRINKRYDFPWQMSKIDANTVPAETVTFSSYPGRAHR